MISTLSKSKRTSRLLLMNMRRGVAITSLYISIILGLTGSIPGCSSFSIIGGQKRCSTRCFSSTRVTSQEQSTSPSNKKRPVLYQKILRPTGSPSGTVNELEFLGSLVALLQDGWDLPTNMPMLFDKHIHEYDMEDQADKNENRAIVTWDSALSPNPKATALHVDVVAVYPEQKSSSILAMVVLSKDAQATAAFKNLPPMLQDLFRDSEQRIVKDLDRLLLDWMHQPSSLRGASTAAATSASARLQQAKRDMLAELMEDMPLEGATSNQNSSSSSSSKTTMTSSPSNIVDAEILLDAKTESKPAEKLQTNTNGRVESASSSTDYAVEAARRVAQQRKVEGFAVQAARQVAARKREQVAANTKPLGENIKVPPDKQTVENKDVSSAHTVPPTTELPIDARQLRPPSLSKEVLSSRSFSQTISRPQDYVKGKAATNSESPSKWTMKDKAGLSEATNQTESKIPVNGGKTPSVLSTDKLWQSSNRKVNIISEDKMDPKEEEQLRLANQALSEVAEFGEDLSAQEILDAVMQFGDEKNKEEKVGDGFVSGAFEKAKEILKEQRQKRDERFRNSAATNVMENFSSTIAPNIKFEETERQLLSPEEELRRMFEAGERLADGRITIVDSAAGALTQPTPEDQKVVDELVAANKEISSYARVLDDELVELEMRINKSPDEQMDGPPKNPIFDIFSGPEVYNPNVDPETAVNWPGALPNTKTMRLPKDLDEAITQARFAASLLSKLDETEENGKKIFQVGERTLTEEQVKNLRTVVTEASDLGLISDPLEIVAERSRLQMIIDELWNQPEERFRDILSEYKDVLLSEHFVGLVKERLREMADRDIDALRREDTRLEKEHERERQILGALVAYAQLLLKETRALGAQLEAQQLEVIRSICKVAMDPSLKTEEETAMALTDAVRDMRPLFDDAFVAYLKYAVAEEEGRLARAGSLDDPEHAQWLYVLKIVQQGVYNEIARGINRYIDHIWYILRMETPKERRMLLEKIVDALPTLDVRPFVQVVDNIAGALGATARGEFDGGMPLGEMTNKILQLHRDVQEVLPSERIAIMSRDADEWAKQRKEKLLQQRRLTKQRLKAAQETEHLDDEIRAIGRRGEVERFD